MTYVVQYNFRDGWKRSVEFSKDYLTPEAARAEFACRWDADQYRVAEAAYTPVPEPVKVPVEVQNLVDALNALEKMNDYNPRLGLTAHDVVDHGAAILSRDGSVGIDFGWSPGDRDSSWRVVQR